MNRKAIAKELTRIAKMISADFGDNVIAETSEGRVVIRNRAKGREQNPNFLIVCKHGDWSGFMPLREALRRLDKLAETQSFKWFAVVER